MTNFYFLFYCTFACIFLFFRTAQSSPRTDARDFFLFSSAPGAGLLIIYYSRRFLPDPRARKNTPVDPKWQNFIFNPTVGRRLKLKCEPTAGEDNLPKPFLPVAHSPMIMYNRDSVAAARGNPRLAAVRPVFGFERVPRL